MERVREKRGPHYDLALVQAAVAARGVACFTRSALDGLRQMGLTSHEALQVLATLKRKDCHKSMTTHGNYKVWQDVYHAPTSAGMAYVKVTLLEPMTGRVVISFKPLQGPN